MRWPVLVVAAVVLLAVGAGAAYVGLRSRAPGGSPSETGGDAEDACACGRSGHGACGLQSRGIGAAAGRRCDAEPGGGRARRHYHDCGVGWNDVRGVRAPGVVEANAYKQVVVTPVVSGRITRVTADLGQHVQRGQTLAADLQSGAGRCADALHLGTRGARGA